MNAYFIALMGQFITSFLSTACYMQKYLWSVNFFTSSALLKCWLVKKAILFPHIQTETILLIILLSTTLLLLIPYTSCSYSIYHTLRLNTTFHCSSLLSLLCQSQVPAAHYRSKKQLMLRVSSLSQRCHPSRKPAKQLSLQRKQNTNKTHRKQKTHLKHWLHHMVPLSNCSGKNGHWAVDCPESKQKGLDVKSGKVSQFLTKVLQLRKRWPLGKVLYLTVYCRSRKIP